MSSIYPYILMLFVVSFYAGNILVGKAINDLSPFTITFFRLFIAFIVLLPIGMRSAWENRSTFLLHKKPFLIMTFTGVIFFNTFIYSALQYTTAANVSVLESLVPVVTIILSALILKERLRRIQWLGVFVSFLGALLVVVGMQITTLLVNWNTGDLIMIGAILSWAIYSILVKQYMHHFPPFAALFLMTGIGVIVIFPVVLIEWLLTGFPTINSSGNILGLLYLGVFPSFLALLFYNQAVDLLGPSQASIWLNFLPVITMIGAYLLLNEAILGAQIIGAFIVISGVILTTGIGQKQRLNE